IIPNQAILEKYLIPGVYLIKDKKVEFRKIEILKQSNNFSLVSGVEIGEEIITKGKENIYDGEVLN
ncbi:MAG: hypothetical protein NWP80_01215, partial [Candidatus Gracilibacteria bacterium]|nr:hypothetical protein [Candidatus Gracilibacteria bacterium]